MSARSLQSKHYLALVSKLLPRWRCQNDFYVKNNLKSAKIGLKLSITYNDEQQHKMITI